MTERPARPSGAVASLRAFGAGVMGAIRALPPSFVGSFVILALATLVIHSKSPIGPGQDYHYHLMVASLNGRAFGDPLRDLYKTVNPLDANTLIYTLSFPLEKITNPVRAFQLTVTGVYFIGLPTATLIALRRIDRAPWGALLAFPLAYCPTWCEGGFMPFLSAAPFFVLAIGEFSRAHASDGKRRRNAMILCAVFCVLTFVGHGHVFTWLGVLLGLMTLGLFFHRLVTALPVDPKRAFYESFSVAWRSLAMIALALALFARWYVSSHTGAGAPRDQAMRSIDAPWAEKFLGAFSLQWVTRGEAEVHYFVALCLVVLACFVFARRSLVHRTGIAFDIALPLTLLSIMLLPVDVSGQTVSRRHIDLSLWLLPFVVLDRIPARPRIVERLVFAALFSVSLARVSYLGKHLALLNNEEYKGLVDIGERCKKLAPGPSSRLAYAALGFESKYWNGRALHQAHETVAALCGIDTPVYDSTVYPHNMLPLRYKNGLPAPVTILSRQPPNSGLFHSFDYVLVQGWKVPKADAQKALPQAELVLESGEFQLWHRR